MRKLKIYKKDDTNVIEFEDGWKIYTTRESLTKEEMAALGTLRLLINPLEQDISEIKEKMEELKQIMQTKGGSP